MKRDLTGTECPCGTTRERNQYHCKACHTSYERNRRNKSPEALKSARKSCQDYRDKLRNDLFGAYGQQCSCKGCNITQREFLTLDHIQNDRKQYMKEINAKTCGVNIYKDLRDKGWPKDKYRILCMNCNFAIRNGGKCPHESEVALQ